VLDGHSNAALAFTRSLGRAGHWVAVGYQSGALARAALSRYCRRSFEYPLPTCNTEYFIEAVRRFVEEEKINLVAPMTDWTVFPISHYRGRFQGLTGLLVPPQEALELASDKHKTILLARTLSIPVPETLLVSSVEDLQAIRSLDFPLVIKDRFSARWLQDKVVFGSTDYAYSRDELLQKVRQRLAAAGDVLVQQFAGGLGVGFSCFALGGSVHLPFQWERVREVDPRGSASSARKSVVVDPQILAFSRLLVKSTGFQGILMVEFKKDPPTGRTVLMEINGRPWGSLQLPIECGIDYPGHVVRWCLEGTVPPEQIDYKKGITCRWLAGDLEHLENLLAGKPLNWPVAYPNFLVSLLKISVPWYPGLRYDDLWLTDPRPGVAGLSRWFRGRFGRKKLENADGSHSLIVRGIVHCHTNFSYDGEVGVSELSAMLRREGFNFVALTEHAEGKTEEDYKTFVHACQRASDEKFIAIPGLEVRCREGVEIAGIGVSWIVGGGTADEAIAQIREVGGYAVWVHPFKGGRWNGPFLDCDAVEVMNGKLDSTVAPNLSLARSVRRDRRAGRRFHALFGLDFHSPEQPRGVWVECRVSEVTPGAIVKSLRQGRFVNRVAFGAMSSSGRIGILDHISLLVLRSAYLLWRAVLVNVPSSAKGFLIAVTRPLVRIFKRSAE